MRFFSGKRRGLLYFSPFLLIGGLYFVTQLFPLTYHIVHLPVDDAIPFVPAFVVPYMIWYLYVPLPLVYMFFTDQDLLRRQALALFPGMAASLLFFLLYPTRIDFRPAAQGAGVFRALCRLIYRFDRPVNVLPSLHCYEALSVHLSTFRSRFGEKHPALRAASAVLVLFICLSTVFIKQHSVVDLVAGCALAIASYALMKIIEKRREPHAAGQTV